MGTVKIICFIKSSSWENQINSLTCFLYLNVHTVKCHPYHVYWQRQEWVSEATFALAMTWFHALVYSMAGTEHLV